LSIHEQQERIPIQLLKEGATETKGKDARKNSFAAVKLITQIVRSSLGPRGMDKMLGGQNLPFSFFIRFWLVSM
jgi:archaeal chaperonin